MTTIIEHAPSGQADTVERESSLAMPRHPVPRARRTKSGHVYSSGNTRGNQSVTWSSSEASTATPGMPYSRAEAERIAFPKRHRFTACVWTSAHRTAPFTATEQAQIRLWGYYQMWWAIRLERWMPARSPSDKRGRAQLVRRAERQAATDQDARAPKEPLPTPRMPRRMRDKAMFYTRDAALAYQLLAMGCHTLASPEQCVAWHEWGFTDIHAPQLALFLRLSASERQYVRLHDWSCPPDNPHPPDRASPGATSYTSETTLAWFATKRRDVREGVELEPDEADEPDEAYWGMEQGAVDAQGNPKALDARRWLRPTVPTAPASLSQAATFATEPDVARAALQAAGAPASRSARKDAGPDYVPGEPQAELAQLLSWEDLLHRPYTEAADDEDDDEDNDETEADTERETGEINQAEGVDWTARAPLSMGRRLTDDRWPRGMLAWRLWTQGRAVSDQLYSPRARQRARQHTEDSLLHPKRTLWIATAEVMRLLNIGDSGVNDWRTRHQIPVQVQGKAHYYRLDDVLARVVERRK